MKLTILSMTKTAVGKKDLPAQFSELVRPDLIKRAVETVQANKAQPYGAKPGAGMRASAELSRRRRDYRGSYGHGISRVPRKILNRRGTRMFWVAAVAPGTVGGRRAHPPKAEKDISKKINVKENRKAIRSALAATMVKTLVEKRGHSVPQDYPFIVETKIEEVKTTKSVETALKKLGLDKELARASVKKKRSGKAKLRGRGMGQKTGPLVVVSKECALFKSAQNIPGVDVVRVDRINAEMLAPGADIGRLTLFTDAAIDRLAKEGLFLQSYKGEQVKKKQEAAEPEQKKETKNKGNAQKAKTLSSKKSEPKKAVKKAPAKKEQ